MFPANRMKVGENMLKLELRKCDDNDYIIKLWNCSTKAPDAVYLFSDYINNVYNHELIELANINDCFIQWCAHIASQMIFEYNATKILDSAFMIKQQYNGDEHNSIDEMLETGYTITAEGYDITLSK